MALISFPELLFVWTCSCCSHWCLNASSSPLSCVYFRLRCIFALLWISSNLLFSMTPKTCLDWVCLDYAFVCLSCAFTFQLNHEVVLSGFYAPLNCCWRRSNCSSACFLRTRPTHIGILLWLFNFSQSGWAPILFSFLGITPRRNWVAKYKKAFTVSNVSTAL